MKVFVIMQDELMESFPVYPLYMKLHDAIEAAEKLVANEQNSVKIMQEFQRKNGELIEYSDWRKIEDYKWIGGYKYNEKITIDVIEVVE